MERQKEFQDVEGKGKAPFSVLSGASCYLDFILPCVTKMELIRPEDLMLGDVKGAAGEMQRKQNLLTGEGSQQVMTILTEKLGKSYQYQYLSGLYVKTTVSELKKKAMIAGNQNLQDRLDKSIDGTGSRNCEGAFTRQMFEEPESLMLFPKDLSLGPRSHVW